MRNLLSNSVGTGSNENIFVASSHSHSCGFRLSEALSVVHVVNQLEMTAGALEPHKCGVGIGDRHLFSRFNLLKPEAQSVNTEIEAS